MTISRTQALAMVILISTESRFARNLNGMVKNEYASGHPVQTSLTNIYKYFDSLVQGSPFNLQSGAIDEQSVRQLWHDGLAIRSALVRDPATVAISFNPPLPYDQPPCPDDGEAGIIWSALK